MSLLDEVREVDEASRIIRCPIGLYLRELDADERAELQDALDSDHKHTSIQTVLRRRSVDIAADAIGAHRRGKCRCRSPMS